MHNSTVRKIPEVGCFFFQISRVFATTVNVCEIQGKYFSISPIWRFALNVVIQSSFVFYHVTAVELLIASSNYAVKWKGLTFSPSVSSKTVCCTHSLEGCQHNPSHFASSFSKLTEGQQFVFSIPVQFPASKFIFL